MRLADAGRAEQKHAIAIGHPARDGELADLFGIDRRLRLEVEALQRTHVRELGDGPEFRAPYRGTAGPWRGTYHTAMGGSLRVPCIVRWPGRVEPGRVSNEMVHVTDLYTTLATLAGAAVPTDRPIDGVDQTPFLFGTQERSSREGFLFYIKNELRARKWRDWKLHLKPPRNLEPAGSREFQPPEFLREEIQIQ